MKKIDNKVLILAIISTILVISSICSLTYAYFSSIINGNEDMTITNAKSSKISLNFVDDDTIALINAVPGDSLIKKFSVENTGTIATSYNINFSDVANSFEDKSDLVYTLNGIDNNLFVDESIVPSVQNSIADNIVIEAGATHNYELKIIFKEKNEPQDDNQNKIFQAKIKINELNDISPSQYLSIKSVQTYPDTGGVDYDITASSSAYRIVAYSYDGKNYVNLDSPQKEVHLSKNVDYRDSIGNLSSVHLYLKDENNGEYDKYMSSIVPDFSTEYSSGELITAVYRNKYMDREYCSLDGQNWYELSNGDVYNRRFYSFGNISIDSLGSGIYCKGIQNDDTKIIKISSQEINSIKMDDIYYSSLYAAFDQASRDEETTIYLMKDQDKIKFPAYLSGKSIVFDMQNHHYTFINNDSVISVEGKLKILDGTIFAPNDVFEISNYSSSYIAELFLENLNSSSSNGNVISQSSGSSTTINGGILTSENSYAINNYGTIHILDGTILAKKDRTIINRKTGNINIKGGNITSNNGDTLLNYGTVDMSGGTITSSIASFIYNYGTMNVTGGNLISKSTYWNSMGNEGTLTLSGNTIVTATKSLGNGTSSNASVKLTIDGATINGTNRIYNYGEMQVKSGTINISNDYGIVNYKTLLIEGSPYIYNNYRSRATIYNAKGSTYTPSSTATIKNKAGGSTIYNQS